jgi:hypothetical protein
VVLTFALVPVVLFCLIVWFAVARRIPQSVYRQVELVFLIEVEILYAVAAVAALVVMPVVGFLYVRGRRVGRLGPKVARGLLCSCCLVVALGAAEAGSAVWQYRTHRTTVMPVGGLRTGAQVNQPLRFAAPPETVELPRKFIDGPEDHGIDLVVLGESSAEGVPYQKWLSIGKIIAWQLTEAIPARPIRLRILARSGDTLERQHLALGQLTHRPEVLLIYCGHNEFQSRLFASGDQAYYVADAAPGFWDQLDDRVSRFSPLCGLIRETADKCRLALPPSPTRRRLVDVPVYTALEYATLLADFHRRLEEMVSYAERLGALPVLILPPANDTGFEPNRSFLSARTARSDRDSFQRAFLKARRREAEDSSTSMEQYRALIAREPTFAEAHYRLAKLLERASAWDDAYRHYVAARDLDGYPMRCPSPFQRAYRDVAERHRCILIDGQSYFHAIGRHGLLDDELFVDAMHPSLRGQIALAQAVLRALHERRAFGWPADLPAPVIDPAKCAAHFGIDRNTWEYLARWGRTFYSMAGRLRYDRSERSRKIDEAQAAGDQIIAGIAPERVGLANVGLPAPVPLISLAPNTTEDAAAPVEASLPFLTERPGP